MPSLFRASHPSFVMPAAHFPPGFDLAAWSRLVRRELARIRLPPQIREEIEQDVLLKLWTLRGELSQVRHKERWIRVVTRNASLCWRRRAVREVLGDEEAWVNVPLAPDPEWTRIEREAEATRISVFRAYLGSREGIRHHCAALFYLDNVPVADIAARLGIPKATVLSHLRRFREAFKKFIGVEDDAATALYA